MTAMSTTGTSIASTGHERIVSAIAVAMSTSPVPDRFVLGAPVRQVFSIPTLVSQRALAISVVEYRDHLHFAFVADRGVIADLPAMADYVFESHEELTQKS